MADAVTLKTCFKFTNNVVIITTVPRIILGMVVAAVALRLVPNCSAPIVTNMESPGCMGVSIPRAMCPDPPC